jgi:hypothetical protein
LLFLIYLIFCYFLWFWSCCARTDYLSLIRRYVLCKTRDIYRERPRYQNTHFLYAQIETKPLCLHWLYCVQNFKTAVHFVNNMKYIKGIRQYIFLLFHFKELLKLYVNLLYRFCVTLLFLEIFWLKIICCPPSWINFYLIVDFSDVISRVSHIKLHLNDQITLCLVWKVVRQFFISNSYWSIW